MGQHTTILIPLLVRYMDDARGLGSFEHDDDGYYHDDDDEHNIPLVVNLHLVAHPHQRYEVVVLLLLDPSIIISSSR